MKITNQLNLPEPIVAAICNDSYTKGDADISVTEMLAPPQQVRLLREYQNDLVEDASDRIWALLGQAVHSIIERATKGANLLTEVTIYTTVLDWKIKGTVDHVTIDENAQADFKVTTVYKLRDGIPIEWIQQANIYRYILVSDYGFQIDKLSVIAILRDWSKLEARRNPGNYPDAQVVRVELPVWTLDETRAFMEARIREHQEATARPCTDEERWLKETRWAVRRKTAVKAAKVFATLAEAEQDLAQRGKDYVIDQRPGEATRCLSYCAAAPWCAQWKNDPSNPDNFFNEIVGSA